MQYSQARFVAATFALAAAVALSAGCASTRARMGTAAGTIPTVDASMNIPALSSSDIAMLRGMSDANILNHLATGDSLEIAMAQVAVNRSDNDELVAFARQMIGDHSRNLNASRALSLHYNIPMTMMPGDTSGIALFNTLDALNAATSTAQFNADYVRSQIALHQRMLAELETLQGVARDQAVRQHIANTIPVVENHLRRAQTVANDLGFSPGGND